MPTSIAFTDVDTSHDGVLRCMVKRGEEQQELWIALPHAYRPAPDLIASAYAALCGRTYDSVQIDVPIGPTAVKAVEDATHAKLSHLKGPDVHREPGEAQALNFSGGFDSLAAKAVLPGAHLVSLDFGGRFARERPMFSRFSPYIVRSNLVDLGLNLNHWSFMGLGSILLRDELRLKTYSFGSIQAGSLPKLFTAPVNQSRLRMPTGVDMEICNPVAGISETGAIAIVARTSPDMLGDVLASVSHPGEVKHLRKRLMLEAVSTRERIAIDLPEVPTLEKLPAWGSRFADDLASLYVMKILGPEAVSASYEGGIPATVVEWVAKTDLLFMERFNPHAYAGLRQSMLADLYARLTQLSVTPYARQDWFDAAGAMKAIRGAL